jgi:hypothetical protein
MPHGTSDRKPSDVYLFHPGMLQIYQADKWHTPQYRAQLLNTNKVLKKLDYLVGG